MKTTFFKLLAAFILYFLAAIASYRAAQIVLLRKFERTYPGLSRAFANAYIMVELLIIWLLSLIIPVKPLARLWYSKAIDYELGAGVHSVEELLEVLLIYVSIWFLYAAYWPQL